MWLTSKKIFYFMFLEVYIILSNANTDGCQKYPLNQLKLQELHKKPQSDFKIWKAYSVIWEKTA